MNVQNSEPGICGCEPSLDHVAEGVVETAATGLSRGVSAALADPIVQALMAADRVDPQGVEELLRRITAQLASRDRVDPQGVEELLRRITAQLASQPDRWRFS